MRRLPELASSAGAALLLLALTTPPALSAADAAGVDSRLEQILTGSHRDPKNAARDVYRHPKEGLLFFGIQPDMTVVEVWPSGGWWTEILAPLLFKTFYDVLKPGAILGVVDHRARPGTTFQRQIESGYLTEEYVIGLAERAGFKLAGRSEINANPKDTADHPRGVWTLPPTLALGDKDRDKYLAIGESDRMTLKFVKPVR